MCVEDHEGRGWVRDEKTGEVVEFGTPRSYEIRAREAEEHAAKVAGETDENGATPITAAKAIRDLLALARIWRLGK